MRSRTVALFVAGAAIVAVAAAAPTDSAPAEAAAPAATVNGVAIDRATLQDTLLELGAPDEVDGDIVRQVLTDLVVIEAMRQTLVDADVDVDGMEIEPIEDPASGRSLPASIAAGDHYRTALAEQHDVDTDEVAEAYATGGRAGDLRCAFVLYTAEPEVDADDLDDAVEQLADEADPDAVADDYDLELVGLGGAGNPCQAEVALSPVLEPLLDALDDTAAGEPTAALDLDELVVIGWVPPFSDVESVVAAPILNEAVGDVIAELLADAEITVDPRYGRWDDEALRIVPLGA